MLNGDKMHHSTTPILVAALLSTGLGVDGRSLWSSQPATHGAQSSDEYILKTAYPIGNGRLGGMVTILFHFILMLTMISYAIWSSWQGVACHEY